MTSMANDNNNIQITDESQIVLYQPNESISLQVKIDAVSYTHLTLPTKA